MIRTLGKIRRSLARDRDLPLAARLAKGVHYVAAAVTAPLYLRRCNQVGARCRTIGAPHVENAGWIGIGSDLVCNSTFAPVALEAARGARLEIGNSAAINYGTSIRATARVLLGDRVSIGPYSIIWDSDAPSAPGLPIDIGDDVWLAGRVTVLPGATIGARSVITAGSIVDGAIPAGVVAGGNPARVIRPVGREVPAAAAAAPMAAPALADVGAGAAAAVTAAAAPAGQGAPLRGVVFADFTIGDLAVRLEDSSESPSMLVTRAPFDQVIPSLLAPPADDATDFCVVWTRPEAVSPACMRTLAFEPATDDELLADVDGFCDILLQAAARYRVMLVPTWTLPAHHRGLGIIDTRQGGAAWAMNLMNQRLMRRLSSAGQVFVLDASRWMEVAGRGASSARAWYMGKIVFHGPILAAAASDIKAAARAIAGQARKLLVLDLDDTLWGGIVGDAGWENLRLGGHDAVGEAFVDFQRLIRQLTHRGVVLGIASKNTESVALQAMESHPAMVLKPADFVGMRINWNDKAANIADLAAELNLGLQSVVFIDDNPVERARVREALPEVFVPEWPEDKLLYPSALASLRCFDTAGISREDASRTALYAAERRRESARQEVGSVDDWLASLGIRVSAEPLHAANVARTTQLLNKTNQMNLSTRRLTEPELMAWKNGPGRALWALSVSDRFGDAGLTGILSVEERGQDCHIVDFVLSCRVMGRRVEECMCALAVGWAARRSLENVVALVKPTPKNKPCQDFWLGSGFAGGVDALRFVWRTENAYPVPACIALEDHAD